MVKQFTGTPYDFPLGEAGTDATLGDAVGAAVTGTTLAL